MPKKPRPIRVDGDVAYITLTRGYVATIDAADVPLVQDRCWFAKPVDDGRIYAGAWNKKHKQGEFLHRFLLGLKKGDKRQGDHINKDTMDYRRSNLRVSTQQENSWNSGIQTNNTSGIIGVSWYARTNRWQAHITVGGNRIHLGYYKKLADAAAVRDAAAKKHHGEFAHLNRAA